MTTLLFLFEWSDSVSLTGKDNEEKIWNFLFSKINNAYGVSGLMGNLMAESSLNPHNLQDSFERKLGFTDNEYVKAIDNGTYTKEQFVYDKAGAFLAQWTWHTRKKALYEYAKSQNKSIGDLEMQLNFLYKELSEGYKSVLSTLKYATSVFQASNAVLLKYECPLDQSVAVQNKRASYGQTYYDKYAKGIGDTIMATNTYQKGKPIKLSSNFNSTEMDCHGSGCCRDTVINSELVKYLQKIRDHFNSPITITSGYRCSIHNKRVGGATGSRHTKGDAADIVVKNVSPIEVAKYAESIGVKGIGLYNTSKDGHFVHIDTREQKSFWYGQAQEYRSTFGGASSGGSSNDNLNTSNGSNNSVNNVNAEYAQSFDKNLAGIYKTTAVLNMRSGAGTSKKILTTMQKGAEVICHGCYTSVDGVKWCYVTHKNTKNVLYTGFVSSKYISK